MLFLMCFYEKRAFVIDNFRLMLYNKMVIRSCVPTEHEEKYRTSEKRKNNGTGEKASRGNNLYGYRFCPMVYRCCKKG